MKAMLRIFAVLFATAIALPGLVQASEFGSSPLDPGQVQQFPMPPVAITQNLSLAVQTGAAVSCNNALSQHTDNSYLRRFDLDADHGLTFPSDVVSVSFGVEFAEAGGVPTTQPVSVRLYVIPSGAQFLFNNLTLIGFSDFNLPDQRLSIWKTFVAGTIMDPIANDLVVEVFTPNGQAVGNRFFIGANNLGEIAPSYIAAAACMLPEPATTASIGFPGMQIVMSVDIHVPVQTVQSSWGSLKATYR